MTQPGTYVIPKLSDVYTVLDVYAAFVILLLVYNVQ